MLSYLKMLKKLFLITLMTTLVAGLIALGWIFFGYGKSRVWVSGSEVSALLKPLSWVQPRADLSQKRFVLGSADFPDLVEQGREGPDSEQMFFQLDPEKFRLSQRADRFRDAQIKLFSQRSFDPKFFRYRRETPHLASWGSLPYPPIKKVPEASKRQPRLTDHLFLKEKYQTELDHITGSELTRNEKITLYRDGASLEAIKKLIGGAKKFILINVLSLACDDPTTEILNALKHRARTGLDVRILINKNYAWLSYSCLKDLERSGIAIVKPKTHASYIVNEAGELLIGSQSLARMFFKSNGTNFLDRDLMLYIKGPIATDAVQDFAAVWAENRSEDDKDIHEYVTWVKNKRADEIARQQRGDRSYAKWLSTNQGLGVCRFAAQYPNQRKTALFALLQNLTQKARHEISFTGVNVTEIPVVHVAREKASQGVQVDILGNGWDGGNGELTMLLNEIIFAEPGRPDSGLGRALSFIRDLDTKKQAKRNYQNFSKLSAPNLTAWAYFNFLHYKAWFFDRTGLWIGSANPDENAMSKFYEAGVLCLDPTLAEAYDKQFQIDLANSVPYPSVATSSDSDSSPNKAPGDPSSGPQPH